MAQVVTKGLSTLKIGAIAGDGGPGTSLALLGQTLRDSISITEDDPTVNEIFSEESALAVYSDSTPGGVTFKWTVVVMDLEVLIAVFGGTASGTAPNRIWNRPAIAPVIEQTVEVTPKAGFKKFTLPRTSISAKFSGTFGSSGAFTVDVTAKVLQPTKTGVGAMQVAE